MGTSTDYPHRRPTVGAVNDRLVWIDCEMTGLDLGTDALIEVAALVTDGDLNVLGEGVDIVIAAPPAALESMGDYVRQMHTSSGLIDKLAIGTTVADAEALVLAYVREWVPEQRKAPLAGNTVGTDRMFLARDMPELERHLHYRNVDVSTIKELSRRWFSRAYHNAPRKAGNHRALADIQESIEELRYYREAVFIPAVARSNADLRDLARRHQGTLTGNRHPKAPIRDEPAVGL